MPAHVVSSESSKTKSLPWQARTKSTLRVDDIAAYAATKSSRWSDWAADTVPNKP